ncbi:hypothetical protein NPIL_547861 [Nephila pilipes]|uniref:Uncharacterized protein n=1 Tax=Nephila pilipes TaxID=299642 RepID=A0A8X6PT55_NEPPI|nr:hypothetical protein NPIL_547861 [Nephila pilipes]
MALMKPGRVLITVVGGVFIIITPRDKRERDRFLPLGGAVLLCRVELLDETANRRVLVDCAEDGPMNAHSIALATCFLFLRYFIITK